MSYQGYDDDIMILLFFLNTAARILLIKYWHSVCVILKLFVCLFYLLFFITELFEPSIPWKLLEQGQNFSIFLVNEWQHLTENIHILVYRLSVFNPQDWLNIVFQSQLSCYENGYRNVGSVTSNTSIARVMKKSWSQHAAPLHVIYFILIAASHCCSQKFQ